MPKENLFSERLVILKKCHQFVESFFAFDNVSQFKSWKRLLPRLSRSVEKSVTDREFFSLIERMHASLLNAHTRLSVYPTKQWYAPPAWGTRLVGKSFALFQRRNYQGTVLQVDQTPVRTILIHHMRRIGSASLNHRVFRASQFLLLSQNPTPCMIKYRSKNKTTTIHVSRRAYSSNRRPARPRIVIENSIARLILYRWSLEEADIHFLARAIQIISKTPLRAVIIDLRWNRGGNGNAAALLAGHFLQKRTLFGSVSERIPGTRLRFRRRKLFVTPQYPPITIPLVILTRIDTISTNEYFIAGLHDNGRATVIGERTGGSSGNPKTFLFDYHGAPVEFMVATWKYTRPNGVKLEGKGINPDIEVREALTSLRDQRDIVLGRALMFARRFPVLG